MAAAHSLPCSLLRVIANTEKSLIIELNFATEGMRKTGNDGLKCRWCD